MSVGVLPKWFQPRLGWTLRTHAKPRRLDLTQSHGERKGFLCLWALGELSVSARNRFGRSGRTLDKAEAGSRRFRQHTLVILSRGPVESGLRVLRDARCVT
jgi:hypothetical protein